MEAFPFSCEQMQGFRKVFIKKKMSELVTRADLFQLWKLKLQRAGN